MSAGLAAAFGATGFFSARAMMPWLQPGGTMAATSFYDTRHLRQTLERLVDFDRLNAGMTRFSAGAVNVRTGNFTYFDTTTHKIAAEHVMASGALPPGFPAVEIDGEQYWDGGLVSNTPLQWVIESDPRLELVTPASLGILTFRRHGLRGASPAEVDVLNGRLLESLAHDGDVLLTSTSIGGRYVLRFCVLNHTSGEADVRYALERVAAFAPEPQGVDRRPASVASASGRDSGIDLAWLRSHGFDADHLRAVPGFESVRDDQAAPFLGAGREESYRSGEQLTERWTYARVFYLVISGRLSVRIDGREVNSLGPGDYLGEIAAIEWGRDFSYGRTATVVATEPSRVLVLPAAALHELMADAPAVDREVRRTAAGRLRRR